MEASLSNRTFPWLPLLAALAVALPARGLEIDPALATYQPVSGISGSLKSIGSDTLNNLMTLWAEQFTRFYPNAKSQIEGKGSSTAPPALISGTAQLAPMSRPMKPEEIDAFEKKFGYRPMELRVAVDALGVFVHKDNPIGSLTMKQVDGIFSSTRIRVASTSTRGGGGGSGSGGGGGRFAATVTGVLSVSSIVVVQPVSATSATR